MSQSIEFVTIQWDDRTVDIEYQWLGNVDAAPLLVFLHEGLGSLAMWKDFPGTLCAAAGCRGLVYSRPAYGQSTARPRNEKWEPDFMHRQAHTVLPAFLDALGIDTCVNPPWLFGHSDGASVALLYAAAFPDRIGGSIVLAPHIMVEDVCIESIEKARQAYLETDLRERLGRYHADPDSAFWGWNDIWLLPAFRDWSIEREISGIRCPLLAIQGVDDEYGTLEQIHAIARRLKQAEIVEFENCGHSPQRDQPRRLVDVSTRFMDKNRLRAKTDRAGFYAQSQI